MIKNRTAFFLMAALTAFFLQRADAAQFRPFGPKDDVIGSPGTYRIKGDESLHEVALWFDLGYKELVAANPGVDPWIPDKGTLINLPTRRVLPDAPREGIVVNTAEMRLYFFDKKKNEVKSYPVGIGKQGFETPPGRYRITEKIWRPTWYVPVSIKKEDPELPESIPPGPDDPLGAYAMRLTDPTILIHGTNRPFGIGRRSSHGCIRMYNADIRELYRAARDYTPVRVVYQPVKIGVLGNGVYAEVHEDYLHRKGGLYKQAVRELIRKGLLKDVDTRLLRQAVLKKTGMPVLVSKGHPR